MGRDEGGREGKREKERKKKRAKERETLSFDPLHCLKEVLRRRPFSLLLSMK